MSRIGKHPIAVPAEVSVTIEAGNVVTVKGPKGTLTQTFHPDMIIKCRQRNIIAIMLCSKNGMVLTHFLYISIRFTI